MKTPSAILPAQQKLYFAGFGVFFVTAVFLCRGNLLFQPLVNEFISFFTAAGAFLVFAASASFCPDRKGKNFIRQQFLFLIFLNLLFFRIYWKNGPERLYFFLPFLLSGWLAGQLDRMVLFPGKFHLACTGGAAAGILLTGFLTAHPEIMNLKYLFTGSLVILIWIVFRLIMKYRVSPAVQVIFLICWVLPAARLVMWNHSENLRPRPDSSHCTAGKPALTVQAALQPNRKNLKILLIGADYQTTEMLRTFPLTRKLVALPLLQGTGIHRRLNAETEDFDLIILHSPLPGSLYAESLYSVCFYQLLKDHLAPGGVLTVWLPEDAMIYRRPYVLDLYGFSGSLLKNIFHNVIPADNESMVLLCGERNITNSPGELNRRANDLLPDSNYLPEGVFLMNPQADDLREQEKLFQRQIHRTDPAQKTDCGQNTLLWKYVRSHPALMNRAMPGKLLDYLREKLLYYLAAGVFLLLVIRYFFSAGIHNKCCWLSLENGMYSGLATVIFMIPFQQFTGRLSHDWQILTGIFLLAGFCGMLVSMKRFHHPLLWRLLLGSTLLLPLCGLAFLHGTRADPIIFYIIAGYAGYTAGMTAGDIQAELPLTLTGFAFGLAAASILYWLPWGMVFAVVLSILIRIPPVAAENLQNAFEKRKKHIILPKY